ncbi:protein kinase [Streptomyces sp. LaPpAH-108]|uniref:protein kinase n=1 Tax=Streptomyces sp. LaPpAH-108 TaxID=1155714 RepID=UPI0003713FFA|nr:protein kinase [Streptomyces sp. LaPpAH-108]
MDEYAGRVLADRYRLPLPPSDAYELTETRAFDTYSGQEVMVRQVPLPEVVEAEVLDAEGLPDGFTARERGRRPSAARGATRRPADPAVRRALEAAQAAARIPDHPRLDQVFDVFAEGGSLWIVSELVSAQPLSALLAEQPLNPYRAAEVASDVLMALRVLHAHGWTHRNITARTVLVCDDGRVLLTGLASGAAEEALCGYDPVPVEPGETSPGQPRQVGAPPGPSGPGKPGGGGAGVPLGAGAADAGALPVRPGPGPAPGPGSGPGPGPSPDAAADTDPEAARRAAIQARAAAAGKEPGASGASGASGQRALESGEDIRAARAGAIAAYRAGARAAARVQESQEGHRAALPGARTPEPGETDATAEGGARSPYPEPRPAEPYPAEPRRTELPAAGAHAERSYANGRETGSPGTIADPYGVAGRPWHGAAPRTGAVPAPSAAPRALGGDTRNGASAHGGEHVHPEHVHPQPAVPAQTGGVSRWDETVPVGTLSRGPGNAIAAERSRQMRMSVVGAVTERWAPEQAGPVHENWQLAAPIGPATDLWALGALLFRAVQGHAPYPEEATAELVQLVCAEPPAFAEECGALRPVVESLLRQDPTERPDVEELAGWLRSLVRSAPEPDAGAHVVPVPPADPRRLPIVRRRGELVRRRRNRAPARNPHGKHKRDRSGPQRSPRSLGRLLVLLVLLLLAGAIAYAMLFLPKRGEDGAAGRDHAGTAGQASPAPSHEQRPSPADSKGDDKAGGKPSASAPAAETQTGGTSVADGFTLRTDPDGFRVAVAKGWDRTPRNNSGQVVYGHGDFELIVVPGRDGTGSYGTDPMAYQRDKERELQPYRSSSWATATGLRTIEVGGRTMAEGQFTWTDASGRDLYVRNMAMLLNGRYHVVQVRGPEAERDEVTRLYDQATSTYRYTG